MFITSQTLQVQSNIMIFTRIIAALLVATVSARALYIPDVLYARESEEFSELSKRNREQQVQMIRDAIARLKAHIIPAIRNDAVPAIRNALGNAIHTRDIDDLGLRSEDALSDVLVARARSPSPSPGPYECNSKADCQQHIDYANKKIQEAEPIVAKLKREVRAAKNNKEQRRKAKNELDTAQGNLSNWEDHKDAYEEMKEHFRN